MKYSKYPSYRDSGVEWLGEIPEHWQLATVSRLFDIKAGGDVKKEYFSEEQSINYPYPIYTNSTKKAAVYGYSEKAFFNENTITVSGRGYIGYAIYREHKYDAIIRLLVLSPRNKKPCKFFMYYINDVLDFQVANTAISQLSTEQISPYKLVLPPFPEQQTIANYLDITTTKIDTLIEKQIKLIELLREKRQAVISTAVTRGLDNTVAMKDSGVEWLGEIPEHWEMSKLKYDSYIKARVGWHGLTSDELFEDGDAYAVTGSDFLGNTVNWADCRKCTLLRYKQDRFIQLQDDDLLVTKDGTIGKIIKVNKLPDIATLNGGIFVLRPLQEKYNTSYYYWLLISTVFNGFVSYYKTGSTISHLYQDTFCQMPYALPTLGEQQDIVDYLDDKTSKIDNLITKSTKAIDLLKEKRTALISSAVTGKIDVREIA